MMSHVLQWKQLVKLRKGTFPRPSAVGFGSYTLAGQK